MLIFQDYCKKFDAVNDSVNPLSANFTKWSDTLKQFVGKLPKCLSVFDHFVGLALKGLILTLFFNIYYISEGNSSVVTMAINISGIENFTEVCRTFGSVFEVGKSGILQLGTVNVTDVQTESLGKSIIFCYCKINQTKKQRKVFVKTNQWFLSLLVIGNSRLKKIMRVYRRTPTTMSFISFKSYIKAALARGLV